jgi:LuxR family maltose regulon positive regulatory protein
MIMPLLSIKLCAPQTLPGLLPRRRLTDKLDAGLQRTLTLVSAPPGFGKTTLLSGWINEREGDLRAGWLSLDHEDNDPARFLSYLITAMQAFHDELGEVALSMLRAPQPPPLEMVLSSLVNELADLYAISPYAQISTAEGSSRCPFVLVLDDCQLIEAPSIHKALAFLIEHIPPHVHLVLSTRSDPPIPLARLRARGLLNELRQADLRFSSEEVAAFLDQAMGLALSDSEVEALEMRTEGWIAGLQLAAVALQGTLPLQRPEAAKNLIKDFDSSHRYVIDYLAEEVLSQQPDEIGEFLRQTAVLDQLSAPLCDAVTGREDSLRLLQHLERSNLFLVPLDHRREWYRYHRLFADFLRSRDDAPPQGPLHRRAALWYEAHGYPAEAVKHLMASGDVEEMGRLVVLAAGDLLQAGQLSTVLGWLDALPEQVVRTRFELSIYKGLGSFLMGEVESAASYAESAQAVVPSDVSRPSLAWLVGLRAYLARILEGNPQKSKALTREALALIESGDLFFRGMLLINLAELEHEDGDLDTAIKTLHKVIQLGWETGIHLATIGAVGNLVLLLNMQGKRRAAVGWCREAIAEHIDRQGRPMPAAGIGYLGLGMMYFEANELERAQRYLHRGFELAQPLAIIGVVRLAKIWLAKLQWARGEGEEALLTMRQALRAEVQFGPLAFTQLMAAVQADLHLGQGNLATAAAWAETADLSDPTLPDYWGWQEHLVYARVLLAQNRLIEAENLLAIIGRAARQNGRHGPLIAVQVLRARVAQALGQADDALSFLEGALQLAAPEGYRRVFLDGDRAMAELLGQVRRHLSDVAEIDFVESLLGAFPQQTPEPQQTSPRALSEAPRWRLPIEPLTERELEILRLIAAGRSNPEIADVLYLSVNTVKWHAKNLYAKLDVGSRVEVVARAQELGLL